MSLLEMTLTGGVMVIVITVLRAVLLNKLPKKAFVFLWEISMLRLVLPFSIPAVTSVYSFFVLFGGSDTAAQSAHEFNASRVPIIASALTEGNFMAAENTWRESTSTGISISVWTIAWLVGMATMFIAFVVGYAVVYRKYRCAALVKGGYIEEWLSEQKIRRSVTIRSSEQNLSPLTYGIFRPTIILPEGIGNEKSEELTYILTHEMTHIRRFDMVRKIAIAAVLCVHWFNPLVWVLFVLYNRDIELACDEAVVRKLDGDHRSAYAMALIGMEERQRGFSSLYNHFSRNAIEERIVAIMKFKKTSALAITATACLIVGTTTVFATTVETKNTDSVQQASQSNESNETVTNISPNDEIESSSSLTHSVTATSETSITPVKDLDSPIKEEPVPAVRAVTLEPGMEIPVPTDGNCIIQVDADGNDRIIVRYSPIESAPSPVMQNEDYSYTENIEDGILRW